MSLVRTTIKFPEETTIKDVLISDILWNRMDYEEKMEFLELIGSEFIEKDYYHVTSEQLEWERESHLTAGVDVLMKKLRENQKAEAIKKASLESKNKKL